jgi:ceramide synthetase
MFIHHILTVILILSSWTTNFVRAGSLIIFLHDISDVFLEGAKTFKSVKYEKHSSVFFVMLVIVWIVTRLGVFPKIVFCTIFKFPTLFPKFPIYYIISSMLVLLLILHILWTFMIFKVSCRLISKKKIEDVRSSTEDE